MGVVPLYYDVVRTPIGLCGVVVGAGRLHRVVLPVGNRSELERRIQGVAPGAERGPAPCRRAVRALFRYFAGGKMPDPGRVDMAGATRFERSVYLALRTVPAGRTVTYAALARRAGRPGAARAVGRAMARNPLPLVIPCHRVVRSDGELGGFSCPGGIALKRRLLEWERGAARSPTAEKRHDGMDKSRGARRKPMSA